MASYLVWSPFIWSTVSFITSSASALTMSVAVFFLILIGSFPKGAIGGNDTTLL